MDTDLNHVFVITSFGDDTKDAVINGPFSSFTEAEDWMDSQPDDDEVLDMYAIPYVDLWDELDFLGTELAEGGTVYVNDPYEEGAGNFFKVIVRK